MSESKVGLAVMGKNPYPVAGSLANTSREGFRKKVFFCYFLVFERVLFTPRLGGNAWRAPDNKHRLGIFLI